MKPQPQTSLECLLIADDLTGACDAAVAFAARGAETEAVLDPGGRNPGSEVVALSTDTRDFPNKIPDDILTEFMQDLASRVPPAQVIFKKIDSTLRGNAGAEIVAVAAAFACEAVLVTPAFPAMQRVVESGYLCVTSQETFAPIDLAAYFRGQGVAECHQVKAWDVETALVWGKRFLSVDAGCDQDLDSIVHAGLGWHRRALFAGSCGPIGPLRRPFSASAPTTLPPWNSKPICSAGGRRCGLTRARHRRAKSSPVCGSPSTLFSACRVEPPRRHWCATCFSPRSKMPAACCFPEGIRRPWYAAPWAWIRSAWWMKSPPAFHSACCAAASRTASS